MSVRKPLAAQMPAVFLLFAMLSSAFYLGAESDHDCIGDGFPGSLPLSLLK